MTDPELPPPDPTPDPLPAPRVRPAAAAALPAPRPFDDGELAAVLRRPAQALAVVLAERQRLAASIGSGSAPWRLVLLLLACTALAALPYGLVLGLPAWWKIAALFGGSVLLCYPSLQVFGSYLGSRLQPLQNLALALVIAAVAALFTLGFCPIVWFLQATMRQGDWIDAAKVSVVLLAAALLAGLAQLTHCVALDRTLRPQPTSYGLLLAWQLLVLFVTLRMARALDLLG